MTHPPDLLPFSSGRIRYRNRFCLNTYPTIIHKTRRLSP